MPRKKPGEPPELSDDNPQVTTTAPVYTTPEHRAPFSRILTSLGTASKHRDGIHFEGLQARMCGDSKKLFRSSLEQVEADLILTELTKEQAKLPDEDNVLADRKAFVRNLTKRRFRDNTEVVLNRPDFEDEIYPLLLLLETYKTQIPGLAYKLDKAIRAEIHDEDFVGMEVFPNATVIRLDVAGSSALRQGESAETAIQKIDELFTVAQQALAQYPKIIPLETGGDELVLAILNTDSAPTPDIEAIAAAFIQDILDRVESISVHVGLASGDLRLQIVPHGHLITSGETYRRAGQSQKSGPWENKSLGDSIKKNRPPQDPLSLEALDPTHRSFVPQIQNIIARIFSTMPRHFLDHPQKDFGNGTAIMIGMSSPTDASPEEEATWWAEFTRIINETAASLDLTPNYFSADGYAILLAGVLGSYPMDQHRRSLKCAQALREACIDSPIHIKAIGINSGPVHFGAFSSTFTSVGGALDGAARQIQANNNHQLGSSSPVNRIHNGNTFSKWKSTHNGPPILVAPHIIDELSARGFEPIHPLGLSANLKGFGEKTIVACTGVETAREPIPMIGRNSERDRALGYLEQVQSEGSLQIEIVGEPGIGKSRLAQDIVAEARKRHFSIYEDEKQTQHPYALIIDILSSIFETQPGELLTENRAFHEWLERSVSPEHAEDYMGVIQVLQQQSTPQNQASLTNTPLFEATLSEIFARITNDHPVCAIIEKPERTDPYSRRILTQTFKKIENRGKIMLITEGFRPSETPWTKSPRLTYTIELKELGFEHLSRMVAHILELKPAQTPEPRVINFIGRTLSGSDEPADSGNPLIVREICYTLLERGHLNISNPDFTGRRTPKLKLPTSVENYVRTKRNELKETHRKVLGVASILRDGTSTVIVKSACLTLGINEADFEKAVLAINASRLAHIDDGKVTFSHGFVANEMEELQTYPPPKTIHSIAARTLSDPTFTTNMDPDSLSMLRSYHLCRAGQPAEAIDVAIQANAERTSLLSAERTYRALIDTLSANTTNPQSNPELPWNRILEVYLLLAQTQTSLGYPVEEIEKTLDRCKGISETIRSGFEIRFNIQKQRCETYYWAESHEKLGIAVAKLNTLVEKHSAELPPRSHEALQKDLYNAYVAYRKTKTFKGANRVIGYQLNVQAFDEIAEKAKTYGHQGIQLEAMRLREQSRAYIGIEAFRTAQSDGEREQARKITRDAVQFMKDTLDKFEAPENTPFAPPPSRICPFLMVIAQCLVQVLKKYGEGTAIAKHGLKIAKQSRSRKNEVISLRILGATIQDHVHALMSDPKNQQRSDILSLIQEGLSYLDQAIRLTEIARTEHTEEQAIAHITIAELLKHRATLEPSEEKSAYHLQKSKAHLEIAYRAAPNTAAGKHARKLMTPEPAPRKS